MYSFVAGPLACHTSERDDRDVAIVSLSLYLSLSVAVSLSPPKSAGKACVVDILQGSERARITIDAEVAVVYLQQ